MEQINPTSPVQLRPIPTSEWMITTLIAAIPLIGFVMLFIWGFSDTTHPSKANWAKATLLWYAIGIVLCLFFIFVVGIGSAMLGNAFGE